MTRDVEIRKMPNGFQVMRRKSLNLDSDLEVLEKVAGPFPTHREAERAAKWWRASSQDTNLPDA